MYSYASFELPSVFLSTSKWFYALCCRVVESSAAKSLIDTYLSSNCEFADVVSDPVMASLSETGDIY